MALENEPYLDQEAEEFLLERENGKEISFKCCFIPFNKPKNLKDILLPCFSDNENWLQ